MLKIAKYVMQISSFEFLMPSFYNEIKFKYFKIKSHCLEIVIVCDFNIFKVYL